MADQAERADVSQIALAAALDDRDDVIRVPQTPSRESLQSPVRQQFEPVCSARALQVEVRSPGVARANGANAAIAPEHLFAQIARIGSQLPFMDAPVGAERGPARRDFQIAPAAERAAVRSRRQRLPIDEAAGHGACCAHKRLNKIRIECFERLCMAGLDSRRCRAT